MAKVCLNCNREIQKPTTREMSKYVAYYQNRCYICGGPLVERQPLEKNNRPMRHETFGRPKSRETKSGKYAGVCDVCAGPISLSHGAHLLTTGEVVASLRYWSWALSKIFGGRAISKHDILHAKRFVASIAKHWTPWVVCHKCISLFNVDYYKTKKYAVRSIKSGGSFLPPGNGPVSMADIDIQAIENIMQKFTSISYNQAIRETAVRKKWWQFWKR